MSEGRVVGTVLFKKAVECASRLEGPIASASRGTSATPSSQVCGVIVKETEVKANLEMSLCLLVHGIEDVGKKQRLNLWMCLIRASDE